MDDVDESGGRSGGESIAVDADCARAKKLGFEAREKCLLSEEVPAERKSEKLIGGKSKIEPQLKKPDNNYAIHCSRKILIEGGDELGD